ncbi:MULTISPECIES: hypothetical protein [unclassified Streptomyces]|uniref:hypothetical protein n=1 Tax=unclassified Streptomyces TaxID=2593676 RepID=UPI000749F748|nr:MULTISPECIES: hypothetical protein [unclassified Streptomyces]KUL80632.1 hypothetical protein ADL34_01620 [Streptomyces sp. NRRL WC-3605]KUL80949.1 hypothetical protein ADL33_00460 [Streptomyces sp. NRRL WC-3604]
MPDRSLRLHTLLPPHPVQGGAHSGVLLRERPSSPPDAPSGGQGGDERGDGRKQDDNPFAPPPEGTPDQPWQPRHPSGDDDAQGRGDGGEPPWGSQWSDRQPGRASGGGFGERPRGGGPEGPGQGGSQGSNMRWDPTDPAQRRARYALLSGMWAFFFALFSWPYVALLLGALSLYWGISSLRAKPRTPDPDNPAPARTGGRPQTTAAVSGLVTASLALAVVAAGFTAQVVYSDYYTCRSDALTSEAEQSCKQLLPEELRGVLGSTE